MNQVQLQMPKQKLFFLAAVLAVLALVSPAYAAFPQPQGLVNDFANILPDKALLEQELQSYEKNTTIEIAVVTLDSLPADQTAATYAVELFQDWGIGKKGEDNGILVLIVKNGAAGNRMRIELGYGIQGYITGPEAGRILDEAMPSYQQSDYQSAVEIILSRLSDDLVDYSPQNPVGSNSGDTVDFILNNLPIFLPIVLFIIFSVLARRGDDLVCPKCGSKNISCKGDDCTCNVCGKRFRRKRRLGFVPIFIGGGGFGGGGGGFGGFGGGGSGGGGAGR